MSSTCSVRKHGRYFILITNGYLDDNLGVELLNQAQQGFAAGFVDFALNLSASPVVNSQGISALFRLAEEVVDNRGGTFSVVGCNPTVLEVFRAIGFSQMADIYPTEQDLPAS